MATNLKVHNIDRSAGTVNLIGKDGELVNWDPGKLAGRTGGVEVYSADTFELRQGDRIRWTKNDAVYGLVNSQTAEVAGVKNGTVSFKLEDGQTLDLKNGRSATTPHRPRLGFHGARVPGSHGRYRHRGDGGQPSPPDDAKDTVRGDQPCAGPGRACDRRPRRATRAAGGRDGRTNIGARSRRTGTESRSWSPRWKQRTIMVGRKSERKRGSSLTSRRKSPNRTVSRWRCNLCDRKSTARSTMRIG